VSKLDGSKTIHSSVIILIVIIVVASNMSIHYEYFLLPSFLSSGNLNVSDHMVPVFHCTFYFDRCDLLYEYYLSLRAIEIVVFFARDME